jgi:hypothetical protein
MLIPSQYGPGLEWLAELRKSSNLIITASGKFGKATSANRMRILGANGPLLLSIPVKKYLKDCPVSEIRIDHLQKWQRQHWRSLFSAYGKSPFFDYFRDELEDLFHRETDLLVEFTIPIQAWILKQYFPKAGVQVNLSACIKVERAIPEAELPFSESIINFKYRQVFGSEFVPGLCVLDHLFCAGPKDIWRLPE